MTMNQVQIGQLVADELKRQGQSVQWLAKQINTSLQNCYKILHANSVNTDTLLRISMALNHNFFSDYATQMELPLVEHPEIYSTPIFNTQFYALVEPFLKHAGYKGHIKNGILTVWIGDPRIEIHHWRDTSTSTYEYVSLWFKLKDKRLKNLFDVGGATFANDLSLTTPFFAITYLYGKHEILATYKCCVYSPTELINHLDVSNYHFCSLYEEFQKRLPQFLEDFSKN
jgi:hypothetical protein